jgi:hypothetical protein
MKETVFFDGTEHQIEPAPITMIFNTTHGESFYPDRMMIDPTMTLEHFNGMTEINPYTEAFFKLVVPDFDKPVTIEAMKRAAMGFRHLIGLFDLSLHLLLLKKAFGWKYPEAYIHPKYQANLGDALILFGMPDKFEAFIRKAQRGE